jgi:hypothetical protein
MQDLSFARVYNVCYPLGQEEFLQRARRRMRHPSLRTRYHWTKHISKMMHTRNPPHRFKDVSPAFERSVRTRLRLNDIALRQRIRFLQRCILRWLFRPGGVMCERVLLPQWNAITSTLRERDAVEAALSAG